MRDLDPRLHGYQRRAVAHLHGTGEPGAGLFMEMGTGKTATVLQALRPEDLPALVLAPRRVAEEVWHVERDVWRPDLDVQPIVGSPATRRNKLARRADVDVISRDLIGDIDPRSHRYRTVVLDELSGYKNRGSIRWRETRKRLAKPDHVWGLTGTPAPNGYLDLFSQIYLLDRGARLGTTLGGYRERYFSPGRRLPITNIVTEWFLKPGAQEAIHERIDDLCLSIAADEYLELPPVSYNEVAFDLPPKVRKVVEGLRGTLVADLGILGMDVKHTAANSGVLVARLRQAAAGFLYMDDDPTQWSVLHDERVRAVQEVVDGTGSPVLVFYQFAAERERLMAAVDGIVHVDEPGSIAAWNRGEVRALLAHPASAGHGLNLQHGGHTIVWSSLPWSLEEWQQGNGRLNRQGQRYPVMIHVVVARGTHDRAVHAALRAKESLQAALMAYLSEDERIMR